MSYLETEMDSKKSTYKVSGPSIFDFQDYSDFLNSYVETHGKYSSGPFNLKNWAIRLGYKSPSSLAMVLSKKRLPTWRMIASFSDDFSLSAIERKYFELLVEIEKRKKSGDDISELIVAASELSGKTEYQYINIDQFSVVSDWYCLVIKNLIDQPVFINDIDWIFNKLRKKVTKAQIKHALKNLHNVGLIEKDSKRGFKVVKYNLRTTDTIPSSAIRNHHRGMLYQANEALDEQSIENRMFQSLTLNMNKSDKVDEAFKELKQFIEDFNNKYADEDNADSVYQLSLQFFEHTLDSKSEN